MSMCELIGYQELEIKLTLKGKKIIGEDKFTYILEKCSNFDSLEKGQFPVLEFIYIPAHLGYTYNYIPKLKCLPMNEGPPAPPHHQTISK